MGHSGVSLECLEGDKSDHGNWARGKSSIGKACCRIQRPRQIHVGAPHHACTMGAYWFTHWSTTRFYILYRMRIPTCGVLLLLRIFLSAYYRHPLTQIPCAEVGPCGSLASNAISHFCKTGQWCQDVARSLHPI